MLDGKRRICVEGECREVGCDGMLGSDVQEDLCRNCGGDGKDCNTVSGVLDNKDLTIGYNDLLLIPAGATNIRITEAKTSNNYLALRNETDYFLNGDWRIDFPGKYAGAGTTFHYEKTVKGSGKIAKLRAIFAPEQIRALGPLTEPVFFVVSSRMHRSLPLFKTFKFPATAKARKNTSESSRT